MKTRNQTKSIFTPKITISEKNLWQIAKLFEKIGRKEEAQKYGDQAESFGNYHSPYKYTN